MNDRDVPHSCLSARHGIRPHADANPLFPDYQPPAPTITWAQERAARIRDGIQVPAELIPYLEYPHPGVAPSARGGRTVPLEFIATMIAAVRHTEAGRQVAGNLDPNDALLMLQCRAGLYEPLADDLAALLKSVNYTMEAWKARVASRALSTFILLKGIARRNASPELLTWIAALTRDLGRKGTRKKKQPA